MPDRSKAVMKGALAGLAAGLVASLVMEGFQRLVTPDDAGDGEPATEKVADAASKAVTGGEVREARKAVAGEFVHYLTGAGLGIAYGVAAEFVPEVTKGAGTAFSAGVAGVLDEGIVPALGFGPAPWKAKPEAHGISLSSHLVFGLVAEGVRRAARSALDRAIP